MDVLACVWVNVMDVMACVCGYVTLVRCMHMCEYVEVMDALALCVCVKSGTVITNQTNGER